MKITAAFALAASILFLTGCDKLSESKDKGLTEIKNIEQRWSDGIQLAHSTARIALSNQVANLQSIKRDLDNVAVSECMQDAKTLLASHMELSIQGFLGFMQEDEYNAERNFKASAKQLQDYKIAKDNCTSSSEPATRVIKIGHVGATSGPVAHLGQDNEKGALLAIEELNAAGIKIGDKVAKFVLLAEDDAADPKQGAAAAQMLVGMCSAPSTSAEGGRGSLKICAAHP